MHRTLVILSLLALSLGMVSAATVTGKIVDAEGKPIKGAIVLLRMNLLDERKTLDLSTDAEGSFAAEVDLTLLRQKTPLGWVIVYAPGYALTEVMLEKNGDAITLNAGATINGTVVDAAGKPLGGVPVCLRSCADSENNNYVSIPDEWHTRFTVRTTADGVWSIPGISPTGKATVALDDDRYVHEEREITLEAGKQVVAVRFTVRPGATVSGRVLTPEGAPASDAQVNISSPQMYSAATTGNGKTAADGSYRFTGLATGTYTLSAVSTKKAWIAEPLNGIALTEGKETTIPDLHAHLGAVLEGTVVDAETGTPIPGVFFRLFHGNTIGNWAHGLLTDKHGHFLDRTQPEQMTILSTEPQYGYQRMQEAEAVHVDLREGKTVSVVLKLHKGLTVTGTVMDGEGKPVKKMVFSLSMPFSKDNIRSWNDMQIYFTTDELGHFEVSGLPVGHGVLTLEHRKLDEWELTTSQAIDVPAEAPIMVRVTRLATHTVSGRVVDAHQHPLSGVTVTAGVSFQQGWAPQELTAVTGSDGGYQLAKIPAGKVISLLWLAKGGYRQPINGTQTNAGKDTLNDAVLGDALLDGTVQDAETGAPLPNTYITLLANGNRIWDRQGTDKDGHFFYRFDQTQQAQLSLLVENPPYGYLRMQDMEAVQVNLRDGKTIAVAIKVRKGLSATGTVTDGEGKPVAGANFFLRMPDTQLRITTDQFGKFEASGLPAGHGTLTLVQQGLDEWEQPTPQDFTLPAKEPMTLKVTRVALHTVSGRVVDTQHHPLAGVTVTFGVSSGWNAAPLMLTAVTGKDGGYLLADIPAGHQVNLLLLEQGSYRQPIGGTLTDAGKDTFDDVVLGNALLDGMVQDAETGTPLPGASVTLYHGNTRLDQCNADRNGHFLYRMQPAQFTLLVEDPPSGYMKMTDTDGVQVNLQDGKTATVVLKVRKGLTVTGTVTDEKGQPIAAADFSLQMQGKDNSWHRFTSDGQGKFEVSGLPVGKGAITLLTYGREPATWTQPEPLAIEVPSKEPIAITLSHVLFHTVRGRVVDTQQHPLAGVTAIFGLFPDGWQNGMYNGCQKLTAITGADGGYQLAKIAAGYEVTLFSLEKPGYCQLFTGLLKQDGNAMIGDAVMMACTATVHGKVCDTAGKPVKGATVISVEVGRSIRAVTDDAGAFTLPNQPNQPECVLHLVAATPTGGGLTTCPANAADIRITCTPSLVAKPRDILLAQALLDADNKLPMDHRRFNRADAIRTIADIDLALATRLSVAGDEPVSDGLRACLLGKQAEKDPSKVDLVQLNVLRDTDCKLHAVVEIGIAVAHTDPGLAEQLYGIARPLYDKWVRQNNRGLDYTVIDGLGRFNGMNCLALAELLHKKADVDAMLAQVNTLAKQPDARNRVDYAPLFEAAGRVSPEFVFKVYDSLGDQSQSGNLYQAVLTMARHDPDAALRLLKMIDAAKCEGVNPNTLLPIIDALGKKDPAAVLALAKAQPDYLRTTALLEAAAFQPKAMASTIIQDAFSMTSNRPTMLINIAKANAIDPKLGAGLYSQYKKQIEADSFTYDNGLYQRIGSCLEYAYRISSIDSVEARLMLETEYARAVSMAEHDEQIDLGGFALPMCTLDMNRAQAMLDAGIKLNAAYNAADRIMQYILMSREERLSLANF